jgi:hypothetical protein
MSKFLFEVQQKNRLEQKGLLQRFSITCYGHQETVEEMRAEKTKKYQELKQHGNKKEMEEWFLNYRPDNTKSDKKSNPKPTANKLKTKKRRKPKQKFLFKMFGPSSRKNKKELY